MKIAPFDSRHITDAAGLVAERYNALLAQIPFLPEKYANPSTIEPKIAQLAAGSPGVVALESGKLRGFLLGMPVSEFKGRRAVYCPEWAHGATLDRAKDTYQGMYRELAPIWVADGRFLHALTIFANDHAGLDGWFWQGFGMLVVDAVRDLSPVAFQLPPDVIVRQMQQKDIPDLQHHDEALRRHLASAPIYLPYVTQDDSTQFEQWLPGADWVMFVAEKAGKVVASLGVGPANETASSVIDDPGTGSVMTAFTIPEVRSLGLATALLDAAIAHLRAIGKQRCAVDFESQNIPGARFWLQHFQPVCYSVLRIVDERVAWAGAERSTVSFWRPTS